MKDMKPPDVDALLEEGSDLIDALIAKDGGQDGEQDAGAELPPGNLSPDLVALVRSKAMFRGVPEELILEAVAQTPELGGLSPKDAAEAVASEPDLMMKLLRVLATLSDDAERQGRSTKEREDAGAGSRAPAGAGNNPGKSEPGAAS